MYVIDTHGLIWHITNDNKLGNEAKKALLDIDNGIELGVIPAIVILEALYVFEKSGKKKDFIGIYDSLRKSTNYLIYPISSQVIKGTINLPAELELHDRIILSIAKLLNAPLITRDSILRKHYDKIIW